MKRSYGIAALLLCFGLGSIVGYLFAVFVTDANIYHFMRQGPEKLTGEFDKRIMEDLNCTAEQRRYFESVMREARQKLHRALAPIGLVFKETMEDAGRRIRTKLAPDQLEKFDRIEREMKQSMPQDMREN